MPTFMLSTVGTALLTNGAATEVRTELYRAANIRSASEAPESVRSLVECRIGELRRSLPEAPPDALRRLSPELNSILAWYGGYWPQNCPDQHRLVVTDTWLCRLTAELVRETLQQYGLNTDIWQPPGLDTADRTRFLRGIDNLVAQCQQELPGYRDARYHIVFNTTGGFKGVLGFLHAIAPLYADEVVYLFESSRDLIRVPSLPLQLNALQVVAPHAALLGLLVESNAVIPADQMPSLPALLVEEMTEAGVNYVAASPWGRLLWREACEAILSDSLLDWPGLTATDAFRQDFRGQTDRTLRVDLQRTLAKVAGLWKESGGDAAKLQDGGGLDYSRLAHIGDGNNDHFRVNRQFRVISRVVADRIELHRFVSHAEMDRMR